MAADVFDISSEALGSIAACADDAQQRGSQHEKKETFVGCFHRVCLFLGLNDFRMHKGTAQHPPMVVSDSQDGAVFLDDCRHLFAGFASAFLNALQQFILFTINVSEVIIGELRPPLFKVTLDDVPIVFDFERIHNQMIVERCRCNYGVKYYLPRGGTKLRLRQREKPTNFSIDLQCPSPETLTSFFTRTLEATIESPTSR